MFVLTIFVAVVSAKNTTILTRKESGTAFAPIDEKMFFFMDSRNVKLNILRPSPRTMLKEDDYKMSDKNSQEYVDFLFNTFDIKIYEFLDLKLVKELRNTLSNHNGNQCPKDTPYPYFNGKWCCSKEKELPKPKSKSWAEEWGIKHGECDGSKLTYKSKCCSGSSYACAEPPCEPYPEISTRKTRDTSLHRLARIQLDSIKIIPNSTDYEENLVHRSRRAIPVVAQFAVVIGAAISSYFLGESVVESDINNMRADIDAEEKALKSLTSAVKLDHSSLSSVVHQLKISPDLILAPNVTTLSPTYKFMKAMTISSGFQHFYANHIGELSAVEGKSFESNILQLQNNRLPLNKDFLVAIRAKCLSLQTVSLALAKEFCNDLAFHATRWDTGLKFAGVGFEQTQKNKIKSTVYSLTLNIPILHDGGLPEYSIINLGRFQSENLIRKISLPQKAVLTASGDIRPLRDHECLQMNSYKICPKEAIGPFDSCLQSVFKGMISKDCVTTDFTSPSTCISYHLNNLMAISMFGNGTMHFDLGKKQHLFKPKDVDSFTVMERQETRGTLFCKQSKHRHISPDLELPPKKTTESDRIIIAEISNIHIDLSSIEPVSAKVTNLDKRLNDATKMLDETEKAIHASHNETNTALTEFKRHISNTVENVESEVGNMFDSVIMKVILPFMLPPLCIAASVFIAWIIFKKCIKKTSETGQNSSSILRFMHMNSRDEEMPITTSTP